MTQYARWFDSPANRIPVHTSLLREPPGSNMFTIRDGLAHFRANHPDMPTFDASQGDGGASLGGVPVNELAEALKRFCPSTAYGTPNGSPALRKVLLENYWKLGHFGLTPDHVIVCDGGRDALQKWYQAVHVSLGESGHAIATSAAPWVSYPHGTYANGFNLICALPNSKTDFMLTPEGIDSCFDQAGDIPVSALILTTPDNPTGTFYTLDQMLRVVNHAYARGIRHILIDVIYQMVIDDDLPLYSWPTFINHLDPEVRVCITLLDGLTKSVGASNVRMAHLMCGNAKLATTIRNIASHTVLPNALSEAAALEVYSAHNVRLHPWVCRIAHPTAQSRKIFNEEMCKRGFEFVTGQGYYGFICVERWLGKDFLTEGQTRIETVADLGNYLTREHGVAVVNGTPFLQPLFVRFSYAQDPATTLGAIERFDQALRALH